MAKYMTVTMKTTQQIGSHSFRLLIHIVSRDDSDGDKVSKTVSINFSSFTLGCISLALGCVDFHLAASSLDGSFFKQLILNSLSIVDLEMC